MTKTISFKNVKFQLNIVKEKETPSFPLEDKKAYEKELRLEKIERERENRLANMYYTNHM